MIMKYKTEEKVLINLINEIDYNQIFMSSDFYYKFKQDLVEKVLNKLVIENKIIKLSGDFGEFYFKSCYIPLIKRYSTVGFDEIAEATARKNGWRIFPSNYASFNKLGLSTQNVVRPIYSSTGPDCTFHYNDVEIKFEQLDFDANNLSTITVMLIQAIKILGKNNVTEKDISCIKNRLSLSKSKQYKDILLKESENENIDFWISDVIKKICE